MSATARLIRVAVAALAVFTLGFGAWWFAAGQDVQSGASERPAAAVPTETTNTPEATATPEPTSTPEPTATPVPTPTPIPTPLPFAEAAPLGDAEDVLTSPLPGCGLLANDDTIAGTVTLACIEDEAVVEVVAAAPGRVVHVSRQPAVDVPVPVAAPGEWSWADQRALGPHVVIDHGPLAGTANTQTVYANLAEIDERVAVGVGVESGAPLGTIVGPRPELRFSVWANDERQDGARVLAEGPSADEQRAVAATLGAILASPTDPLCPLVRSASQLPGASRSYRNGTHRGIDFGCGTGGRFAYAVADGTVAYLVNDYVDPTVEQREQLLANAGIAGFTPAWTLVMLYGNVVVIDHGEIPGAGRLVSIAAHLEAVDDNIALGDSVTQGDVLGELGYRARTLLLLGFGAAPTHRCTCIGNSSSTTGIWVLGSIRQRLPNW